MLMRHFLWWHRHNADRTEVLVIFETMPDLMIVSVSDSMGVDLVLTEDEQHALWQLVDDRSEVDRRAA